jgi:hypothetical protein
MVFEGIQQPFSSLPRHDCSERRRIRKGREQSCRYRTLRVYLFVFPAAILAFDDVNLHTPVPPLASDCVSHLATASFPDFSETGPLAAHPP